MGFWTNKDHRTIADDTDDFTTPPSGGRCKQWVGGMLVAAIPIIFGVKCLIRGDAVLFGNRSSSLHLTGTAATALNTAYIAFGCFLHFHYFWGLDENLCRYSQTGKTISLLVFIPCFLFALYDGLHIASWIQ